MLISATSDKHEKWNELAFYQYQSTIFAFSRMASSFWTSNKVKLSFDEGIEGRRWERTPVVSADQNDQVFEGADMAESLKKWHSIMIGICTFEKTHSKSFTSFVRSRKSIKKDSDRTCKSFTSLWYGAFYSWLFLRLSMIAPAPTIMVTLVN
jgi:hypothetical protein